MGGRRRRGGGWVGKGGVGGRVGGREGGREGGWEGGRWVCGCGECMCVCVLLVVYNVMSTKLGGVGIVFYSQTK